MTLTAMECHGSVQEAERSRDRRKVQIAVCGADLRGSSSSLGGVPGDAHKRTRHGTAETTTMKKTVAQLRTKQIPRTRRPETKTRLFAAMKSLFYSLRKSTHPQRSAGGERQQLGGRAAQYVDDDSDGGMT